VVGGRGLLASVYGGDILHGVTVTALVGTEKAVREDIPRLRVA
jgi:hypothetical protein